MGAAALVLKRRMEAWQQHDKAVIIVAAQAEP